ncbi:DUF6682 family protein [Bowmanella sp. JS7-9]|uniref:DUF6682 family protein n=1 Tax=Pseudobowmanella zhangzhouensis TaxID=1537679 RepID=A0ABW1XPE8_9ALTE|nr:DUF6682 family protein [Bowmanella sp. JS7-9]TBX21922.1 hypothetical protein TK45_10565 [Bowmanella sp. JS7-9]
MATTKIIDLISRAETIVQDKTSVRWPKQEWLNWFNDAVLAVIIARPDASVVNEDFTLDETDSKQSLPNDALRLMTVVRNKASGVPVRQIARHQLDDQLPDWHTKTASTVDHYVYDERDPKHFYVFPRPSAASHVVELIYSTAPAAVTIADFTTDTQTLSLDDSYLNPLLDFMLYRAYSKDAEYAENAQRAAGHLNAFNSLLGIKTQSDTAMAGQAKNP